MILPSVVTSPAKGLEMTDERDLTQDTASTGLPVGSSSVSVPSVSRRAVLRGATAVVPTILTLHSGAALARSSNLIGAAPNPGPNGGRYNCLDFDGLEPTGNPNVFDLGNPPYAHVTRIDADTQYFRVESSGRRDKHGGQDDGRREPVDPRTMCAEGGTFYRQRDGRGYWGDDKGFQVKRGVLVSATALSSFSSGIKYTDV